MNNSPGHWSTQVSSSAEILRTNESPNTPTGSSRLRRRRSTRRGAEAAPGSERNRRGLRTPPRRRRRLELRRRGVRRTERRPPQRDRLPLILQISAYIRRFHRIRVWARPWGIDVEGAAPPRPPLPRPSATTVATRAAAGTARRGTRGRRTRVEGHRRDRGPVTPRRSVETSVW